MPSSSRAVPSGTGGAFEVSSAVSATQVTVDAELPYDTGLATFSIPAGQKRLVRFHVPEGSMRPLTHSTIGLLFLSLLSDADAETMIRHINAAERDPNQRRHIPHQLRQIAEIRRSGYCFIPNMPMEGAGTVSMLLPWDMYGRPLAVGVGGYVGRVQPNMQAIIATMRAALRRHGKRRNGRVLPPNLTERGTRAAE